MSTQTLKTIALDVVGQYYEAGKHLAAAYQTGVERATRAVEERFVAAVQSSSLPLVTDTVKSQLIDAQKKASDAVVNGFADGSKRVAEFNDRVAEGVKAGIERLSSVRPGYEQVAKAADAVAQLGLPSAQFSLKVANAVNEGSKRLSERVAGFGQTAAA